MNTFHVAGDVIREAFARKLLLGLFAAITVSLLLLVFALDLEVVEGTLAAGRLFGMDLQNPIVPVDVAMGTIFSFMAAFVFYWGLLFGIVTTSGIAADMLAPGRVELLLSLPIRRVELVVGTYLGVVGIAVLATTYAVGGASLILFVKTGTATSAPFFGALMAVVGFMPIYAIMLAATALVRSTVFAAGSGITLFVVATAVSNREAFLALYEPGFWKELLGVLITPLPKLAVLADIGRRLALDEPGVIELLGPSLGNVTLFSVALVAAATLVISGKDY